MNYCYILSIEYKKFLFNIKEIVTTIAFMKQYFSLLFFISFFDLQKEKS